MLKSKNIPTLFMKLLLICATASPCLMGRSKLDVIHLSNGDTVTGEIKRLERGILTVSTDFMGTVSIEWRGVARVTSPQTFDVEMGSGARFSGTMPESDREGVIRISETDQNIETLESPDIVRMRSLDKTFADRWDARIDLGFDVTRANRSVTYNLSSETNYTTEKATTALSFASFLTRQKDLETLKRNDLEFSHERRFKERWFGVALGKFQQNEELGLALRSLGGGGVGHYLKQTNHWILKTTGGMSLMRERFLEADSQVNVEGLAALSLDYFRFEGRARDISTRVVFWPNLSDVGRLRIDISSAVRYEIFKDFFWGFIIWNNYDSRPPTGAEKNDFGVSSTIGYKF